MTRVEQFTKVQNEGLATFKQKNADYDDSFAHHGVLGTLIRIHDKLNRFTSVSNKQIALVDDEKLRDTLMDLANYAHIAVFLLDEGKEDDV